jgi:hypothetical protein
MFYPFEAFFFRSGNHVAIHENSGRRIGMVSVESEYDH